MVHLFFLLLYGDDMLIAANSMSGVNKLKTLLSREFDMKDLGAVCLFLYRLKTPQIHIVTRALHFSCIYVTLDKFA